MIKIENLEVSGWLTAIRGMRNPMNSWDKSDSFEGCVTAKCDCSICTLKCDSDMRDEIDTFIGDNDLKLMKQLASLGSDDRKFMRMINVTMDITAPLYWWKEFDTYKVGTVANSCSTMHKLCHKEFELSDFSFDHCDSDLEETMTLYINMLNYYRNIYLSSKSKGAWYTIIQLLPSSYNQRRTVQLNYEVLRNMWRARRNHKLDEWKDFCKFIETSVTFSKELICL